MGADDPMILLDRISLRIRDRILFRDTTWKIETGQHWVIIGPNGAGKTTIAGALAGRVPVVGGKIHWPDFLFERDAIGYVSWERQRGIFLRDADRDEARFFSGCPQDAFRVKHLFSAAKFAGGMQSPLVSLWDRPLRSLSTGERSLVFLVREVLKRPRLLVLDEPFAGLDAPNRQWLQQTLEKQMADHVQLVLVTHRSQEILPGISHVLAVKNGQVCFCGPRGEAFGADHPEPLFGHRPGRSPLSRRRPLPAVRRAAWIELRKVTVRYDRRVVLRDVDWKICDGENWAVVGPNGAGKSTLMQLIAGDHPQAYANEILWFGRRRGSGETLWEIKKEIGMVSAEFQLLYHRPVRSFDVVVSGFFDSIGLYRTASSRQRKTAAGWMRRLGLDSLAERRFDTLSGGEQRGILLARALVKSPRLLILDEPCQGLDRSARFRFQAQMDAVGCNRGVQLLYVTHILSELPACMTHCLQLLPLADGSFTAEASRWQGGRV